jgi:hypothetical protein
MVLKYLKYFCEGFAGKSHHSHGGGVNYLCLPRDPEFPTGCSTTHQSKSYIYGVEYEQSSSPLMHYSKHNNDVPCAVCQVVGRSDTIMIPAKSKCPTNWHKEYQGLLMAQQHTQKSSEYICVDEDMDVLHGGSRDSDGGSLYVVEAACGSLTCPPYEDGKEIMCTVCTF